MRHNESQIEAARKIYDLFWNSYPAVDCKTEVPRKELKVNYKIKTETTLR